MLKFNKRKGLMARRKKSLFLQMLLKQEHTLHIQQSRAAPAAPGPRPSAQPVEC
jgi:hypothetical protein